MAALQNPVSLQSRTKPVSPASSKTLAAKPFSLSFSATFTPLRHPTLKLSANSRGGTLGARMTDTAAGSYASALAEVAKTNDTLETTSADVEKIDKIFSDEQVYEFFASPVTDNEKKRVVLDEITASSGLQLHTSNFLNILIDMKRIELVKDIVKEFEVVYNKITETELAVVTSVVTLENEHLTQIAKGVQQLSGAKNVKVKTVIDPSLVAGFTIRYGNGGSKLVDMSVRKQLEEIASTLNFGDIQLAV